MLWANKYSTGYIADRHNMSRQWVYWKVKQIKGHMARRAKLAGITSADVFGG
jgi:predicted DNA-binding protein YlxM (UPF0122 family)